MNLRMLFPGLLGLALLSSVSTLVASDQVDYEKQIKPIFTARCVACHGALKQAASLRLDTAALAIRGGENGAAVIPGDASASRLLMRVSATDPEERMPPEGDALTPQQLAALRGWIAEGAKSPANERPERDPQEHWAFRPLVRPPVPRPADSADSENPIDAFIADYQRQQGLAPQTEATRTDLVRRLYLDLVGLPPTAEDWARVDSDRSDDWYERLSQSLLDDPRHGERWARHWMDVWRYSDWWGLGDQLRNSQPHIWHWRDWIVESLNADLSYDEMVRLMLAADELHPNDLDKLRATGFLARNYFLFNRNQWMDETVEHVSKGFLGLTMNCAKCHDHKFDPIEQDDYYRMRAFFEPYHVRLDIVPDEVDLGRDGIPRVFDGQLDAPTYRFIRGQETQPDKSAIIAPNVPKFLAFRKLTVAPVSLPAEAWQPERREWVREAYVAAAEKSVAAAAGALAAANQTLETANRRAAPPGTVPDAEAGEPIRASADKAPTPPSNQFSERFETLDPKRWRTFGGEWTHEPGRVQQKQDGAARAGLRLLQDVPRDFDASLRFTIFGGSKWRSVCLGFDSTQVDPQRAAAALDTEQTVYVSAVAGGSKIQAAHSRAGNWEYPAEAMAARPIELGREYTLRVQVRGSLINATLDGEPVLAWRTPLARCQGALQLTTYDALVDFHEVTVAPLSAEAVLREPGNLPATAALAQTALREATADVRLAELELARATAELSSLTCRIEAMQAAWAKADDATKNPILAEVVTSKAAAAVRAERQAELAKARRDVAGAEVRLLRAAADKHEPIEKELKSARESLDKNSKHATSVVTANDRFASLTGAKWTPTRFLSSTTDDPTVTFGPQSTGRRKALAEWITDRQNPLTARVAVNHLWARHLGTPLVATTFDFGRKGSPPAQAELLDWLAAEFIDSGWSMKHVHRLIVTSATYRRSSSLLGQEANLAKDPDNVGWWRRTPIRLESQVVRDSILALSGTLDLTRGGPPVEAARQADSRRRSLYFFHSYNERNLLLTTFDDAAVKECYRRDESIVPQQALALTNGRLVLDASQLIAQRLSQTQDASKPQLDDTAFAKRAFLELLGVTASDAELAASMKALERWRQLSAEQDAAARTYLVWVLLNHNDFVTVR